MHIISSVFFSASVTPEQVLVRKFLIHKVKINKDLNVEIRFRGVICLHWGRPLKVP